MSANVDTMFSTREVPWHGLGEILDNPPTSREAILAAGLDWEVKSQAMYIQTGKGLKEVPNVIANVRSDNKTVLGTVTGRYKLVQNAEAFDFMDSLLGSGKDKITYETAGALGQGERIWLLANLGKDSILDEEYNKYILFFNSHDGKGSLVACPTNVRVVCQNTANLALSTARRSWKIRHTGNLAGKIEEAQNTLNLARTYTEALKVEAEKFSKIKISDKKFTMMVEEIFPMSEDDDRLSIRQKNNLLELRENLTTRYLQAPDLEQWRGTAWGVINAVTDFVDHSEPQRNTATFKERRFAQVMDGHPMVDRVVNMLRAS